MYDGRMVDVLNLQPEDVRPHNFIHSICNLNRYTGHLPFPISVGLHSLRMAERVPPHLRQAALIHDWSEACFNDIASPIKATLGNYKKHEKAAGRVIFDAMHVPYELLAEIKQYDVKIRQDERIATWGYENWKSDKWTHDGDAQPIGITFVEQHWRDVRAEYTDYFVRYFPEQDLITWRT
ncbi:hypothetical protein CQ13_30055 [Bradyrhizobium retamae]|uniref:Phosphohydrolase n=2 Tax=Bradyrhizobium retamae TaxID=1300035 RepID=A0A0R3MWU4_9BRAD|nr:hypothetical protein CQ13_30055 [Bradyrhizobium retamae]